MSVSPDPDEQSKERRILVWNGRIEQLAGERLDGARPWHIKEAAEALRGEITTGNPLGNARGLCDD